MSGQQSAVVSSLTINGNENVLMLLLRQGNNIIDMCQYEWFLAMSPGHCVYDCLQNMSW